MGGGGRGGDRDRELDRQTDRQAGRVIENEGDQERAEKFAQVNARGLNVSWDFLSSTLFLQVIREICVIVMEFFAGVSLTYCQHRVHFH